jgi:hypothetical protein
MSITDGQRVRALESNASWASKSANNTLSGVQTLSNGGSGPAIANVQQKINDLDAAVVTAQNDISNLQTDVATLQALDTFIYAGQWDASTNTPTLADGDGGVTFGTGATLRVSVAGTQDLGSGSQTFQVGDKVVYNIVGVWEKWDTNDADMSLDDLDDVDTTGVVQRSLLQKGLTDWEDLNPNEISALTGANQTVPATEGFFKVIRLTNAGLVSVEAIGYTHDQQKIILVNETGVDIDVLNDAAGVPTNGIVTGTGNDLTLSNEQTLLLVYDANKARWRVVGGTGSGGSVGFQEELGGAVNGLNTTFGPMTYLPANDDSILVSVNGLTLRNDEWSVSGSNIILSVAPSVGQRVYVFYVTQGAIAPPPVISGVWKTEYRTLTAPEAAAKAITLVQTPAASGEVMLDIAGGGAQFYGDDFVVSVATLSWNGLALDGILSAGDKLRVAYVY